MTRLRTFSLIVTIICLTTMLSACTNAVLFTTASIIGIEMNTAENGQQSLKFGYHRFEGVVMPHTLKGGGVRDQAYDVRSIFEMDTGPFLQSWGSIVHTPHGLMASESASAFAAFSRSFTTKHV